MSIFYCNETGGFYVSEIHGDRIPPGAVQIEEDEHTALLVGQSEGKRIEPDKHGRPALIDPPPPPVEVTAARAEADVRRQSAAARNAWRTPDKDGVYRLKLDDAAAWRTAGEPADLSSYPHLAAEVGITAPTAGELAALWDAMAAAWVQASAGIEAVEQGALKAIRDAVAGDDVAAIEAVPSGLVWPTPPAQ